ncbi:MraY family glycosyltransferase [Halocola ammonii]
MKTYFAILLFVLFALAVATYQILLRNFFDRIREVPSGRIRKFIKLRTPWFGGVGIILVLVLGAVSGSIQFELHFLNQSQFLIISILTILAFVTGFLIDLRKLKLNFLFLFQLLCGLALAVSSLKIEISELDWVNSLITVIWVMWLMNAIRWLNSMNAIATLVAAFTSVFFMLHLSVTGFADSLSLILLGSLWASLMAFLFFNWFPARLGLGVSGSQLVGFLLAVFSILICWNGQGVKATTGGYNGLAVALYVFLLPLLASALVFANRMISKYSLKAKKKDQLAWQLHYFGVEKNLVASIFSFLTVIHFVMAVYAAYYIGQWTTILSLVFIGYPIFLFLTFLLIARKNLQRKKYSY